MTLQPKLNIIYQAPPSSLHQTPLLFVHGAWHGAWCYEPYFLPYFTQLGFHAYALDLRGHDRSKGKNRLRWWSVFDYVADVATVADQIERTHGQRPVIIGHSMGGFITQKYLETHAAPAGILLASIPVSGFMLPFLRHTLKYPLTILRTGLAMYPYYMIGTPELTHKSFFSDSMPRAEVERYFARIQSESFRVAMEVNLFVRLHPERVKAPMLVLAAENDRVFTVHEEQQTATAYNTTAEVFPKMAHDMMLEAGWQAVADRIIAWLKARSL